MKPRDLRSAAVCATLALVLIPLAACTATAQSPTRDSSVESTSEESVPAAEEGGDTHVASGERYGCTDAVLEYAQTNGYPEAVPLDPATLEIPLVQFGTPPDCYLIDEYSEAVRYSAFWQTDPQGVLTALGASLSEAGYVQSEDFGPLVWWVNGEDPTVAEHAISAAPQPVDGVDMLWATW